MAANDTNSGATPFWLDLSLRILSVALIPLVIAVVGSRYTSASTAAQIEASRAAAREELTLNLIDKTSQHLKDPEPTVATAYLLMLARADPACAAIFREVISEPNAKASPVRPDLVSPAVRAAVRAQAAQQPIAVQQPADGVKWFAVLSAYATYSEAKEEAEKAALLLAGTRQPIVVYQSRNGAYALTLGGPLHDARTTADYVARARQVSRVEFGSAYAWRGGNWTQVLAVPCPAR